MKTVILFGSPRKDGNTIQLVNILSRTLKNKGHSVRILYLNDMNIRPCQGCYACLKKGICKINDDMKDIRKYIME
ncbi:MAG: flavodoxin family protein, partial [Proteobacteria bacterium]|nr:flavodoxin family protein [Pseudomonadota bacterium]